MPTSTRPVRIEWSDCDPMGIVFYPRYLAMFDDCTAYLFERACGMKKSELVKVYDFTGFPLVDVRLRFRIPSRFGDDVVIESKIVEFRRSSFDVEHRLLKSGELAVEGLETRVWVGPHPDDPGGLKSRPIPPEVKARFAVT